VARGAIAFIEAMNFQRVDLFGVSIGSSVAQDSASCARNNVHRMAPGKAVRSGRRVTQEFILG
jgi:hypothetical protein